MSEEHIPIPEGWRDPRFRGGSGPEFDPVSMAYPVLVPPGGPGFGPGVKPAGVVGMVRAGEIAGRIPAPMPTPRGLVAAGYGGGPTFQRKPIGSSADGPLIHAADAWMMTLNTGPGGQAFMIGHEWSPEGVYEWPAAEPALPTLAESEEDLPLFPPIRERPRLSTDPELPKNPNGAPPVESPSTERPRLIPPDSPLGPIIWKIRLSREMWVGLKEYFGHAMRNQYVRIVHRFNANVSRFYGLWRRWGRTSQDIDDLFSDAFWQLVGVLSCVQDLYDRLERLAPPPLYLPPRDPSQQRRHFERILETARICLRNKDEALDAIENKVK